MANLVAGQLESRNIGSNISFNWEGKRIHGGIGIIEKYGDRVDVTLTTSNEVYELSSFDEVLVHLTAEAQFSLYTRDAMNQLIAALSPNRLAAA